MRQALFGLAAKKDKPAAQAPAAPAQPAGDDTAARRAAALAAMRGDKSRGSSLLKGALFGGGVNRLLS